MFALLLLNMQSKPIALKDKNQLTNPKIMKQKNKNLTSLFALSLFTLSTFMQAQENKVSSKSTNEKGLPSLITFKENSSYKTTDSKQIFQEQLGLKQNQNYNLLKTETDQQGLTHQKYQLFQQGIKVEYGTYTLHSKNGKISSMSGEFYDSKNSKTSASISAKDALSKAIAYTGASNYMWDNVAEAKFMNYQKPVGELVFLPNMAEQGLTSAKNDLKLAYKFDIYATAPLSRGDLYIDANTGEVLYYNATIKHLGKFAHGHNSGSVHKNENSEAKSAFVAANAATRYAGSQTIQTLLSGTSYILSDNTRGGGMQTFNCKKTTNYTTATNFTDVNNDWTAAEFANVNKDNAALDAHWGAEKTYDYWSSIHGRNSYDNAGAKINSYVHYNTAYDNAFWDGTRMTYGDGSGTYFDALTSIDVAAHEIGHAVCEKTANLAYQKESGAMNEGFSDIWGACVEYFAAPLKSTWLIGEDIERRAGHAALRSMSNPKAEGQPDTYGGTNWKVINCGTPTSTNDYCGVHTNSGVLNHWFYILSVGKSGTNDIGSAYNVTGITIDKAAKIAYKLESTYLSANSTFANARTGGIQAATDLYGAGSAEVIATTNAWYAVGVGAAYVTTVIDTTAPTTPTTLTSSGATATSVNLLWTASTDNVGVSLYNIYNGTTLLFTAATNSAALTGLTAATTYNFSVKAKDAAGNLSAASNTVTVTTGAATVTYCASTSSNTADEKIGKVVLGTINNTSTGTAGYENFTSLSTNIVRGAANTITITPKWTSTVYSEGYAVWIDYNRNGLFTDAGELVFSKATSTATSATGTFTVPSTIALGLGAMRMRVSMKYNGVPTSCETLAYGQVEDYTVFVTATAAGIAGIAEAKSNNITAGFEVNLYPNPAEDVLNITSLNGNFEGSYAIINTIGQMVKSGNITKDGINVNEMKTGVYFIQVTNGAESVTKKFMKK